jgi:hypothetical protein
MVVSEKSNKMLKFHMYHAIYFNKPHIDIGHIYERNAEYFRTIFHQKTIIFISTTKFAKNHAHKNAKVQYTPIIGIAKI